jgi:hypothetical protein
MGWSFSSHCDHAWSVTDQTNSEGLPSTPDPSDFAHWECAHWDHIPKVDEDCKHLGYLMSDSGELYGS